MKKMIVTLFLLVAFCVVSIPVVYASDEGVTASETSKPAKKKGKKAKKGAEKKEGEEAK